MILDIEKPIYAYKGTEELGLVESINFISKMIKVNNKEFNLNEVILFHNMEEL